MPCLIEKKERSLEERFRYLLEAAHKKTGLGVVVLVDEYDKSLLESEGEALEEARKLFKGFFGNLKSCDEHLQFVFITDVTKYLDNKCKTVCVCKKAGRGWSFCF